MELYYPRDDKTDRIHLSKAPDVRHTFHHDGDDGEILLQGRGINASISNAIRRTMVTEIPIMGWHHSEVNIDPEGTETYQNYDVIRNNFEQLPPPYNLDNPFDVQDPHLYLTNEVLTELYSGYVRNRQAGEPEMDLDGRNIQQVEASLRVVNQNAGLRYVTTHDLMLKVDGREVDNYKSRPPVAFYGLRKGEKLTLRAEGILGLSRMSSTFSAVTVPGHEKLEDGWVIRYTSMGQLTPLSIYKKTLTILRRKTEILLGYLREHTMDQEEKDGVVEYSVKIYGEDDTIANPISTTLAQSRGVSRAGYLRQHLLERMVEIKWVVDEGNDGAAIMLRVLEYLVALWKKLAEGL